MNYPRFIFYLVVFILPLSSFGFSVAYFSYTKTDTIVLSYFKKVGSDSAYIYFTNDFKFTEVTCAGIIRHTPLNEKGFQTGLYKDYTINKRLIGIGSYYSSLRNGWFETYYEDGQIKSQGKFIEDIPSGVWNYFEADGSVKRKLDYSEKIVKLVSASHTGKRMIKNGNGKFKGSFFSLVLNEEMYATGRIYNGLMEGKWRVWQKNKRNLSQPFSTEFFNSGKFVLGSLTSAGNRFQREYFTKSIISLLEPEYYFLIEQGKVISCEDLNSKRPELVYIDQARIKDMVNQKVRRQQSINRSVKTEQVYNLVINQNGNVNSVESVSMEDVYQLDNELKKVLMNSRWKPGKNSQGSTSSTITLIIEFNPMSVAGQYDITTRVK